MNITIKHNPELSGTQASTVEPLLCKHLYDPLLIRGVPLLGLKRIIILNTWIFVCFQTSIQKSDCVPVITAASSKVAGWLLGWQWMWVIVHAAQFLLKRIANHLYMWKYFWTKNALLIASCVTKPSCTTVGQRRTDLLFTTEASVQHRGGSTTLQVVRWKHGLGMHPWTCGVP